MENEISILQKGGIANPRRVVNLIHKTIDFFELDLSGLVVLTEAASGHYVVTPVIAAMAGAKRVIALTRDSRYATVDEVTRQTRALESLCGVKTLIEIHTERNPALFAEADIVTNLGFVRPLDTGTIAALKPGSVIPLMCEAWEFRPGDVDLATCNNKGIPVIGTNEDYPGLEVFNYSGWLCQKMLFDAQIEIHKSNILIVSSDKFGQVIEKHLLRLGVSAQRVNKLDNPEDLTGKDAVIVADYTRKDTIIGSGGDISAEVLAQQTPHVTVIQFAGHINIAELIQFAIAIYPGKELEAHRMALTLADLGTRPVIELHAAGLKVGEIAFKKIASAQNNELLQSLELIGTEK